MAKLLDWHSERKLSRLLPPPFVHIAIPVRNEEKHIEDTLEALSKQYDRLGRRIPWAQYEVLIFANNCEDYSSMRARRFGDRNPGFRLVVTDFKLGREHAHIGWARRLAMEESAARSLAHSPDGILATTDADSRVSPFWLGALLEEFAKGADAVCGRILLDPAECLTCDAVTLARHEADEEYRLLAARLEDVLDPVHYDPWPRHHQHFGANFAVRANMFLAAGGVPPVNGLEDVALFNELVARDARVRHTFGARVTTSARKDGRSAIGLSAQLRDWSVRERSHVVESTAFLSRLFHVRATLRGIWTSPRPDADLRDVAAHTGISLREIHEQLTKHVYFGSALRALRLRERLSERWPGSIFQSPAVEIAKLKSLVSHTAVKTAGGTDPSGISHAFRHGREEIQVA